MDLLDLPIELLSQITQLVFSPWDLRLVKSLSASENLIICDGFPQEGISLTSRFFHREAQKAIKKSFSGRLIAEGHNGHHVGTLCDAFVREARSKGSQQFNYYIDRVHAIRYINPGQNPSLWRMRTDLTIYPKLRCIELDCRYRFHFAVHTVPKMSYFLDGSDGELVKCMDFRKAFFLSCERFIDYAVKQGVTVRVIREMGVREGMSRCHAVLIVADYIYEEPDGLQLDLTTVRSQSAPIIGWPHGIRAALDTLII